MDARVTSADRILDSLEGATIVCARVDEGDGMLLNLADGRVLVIAGVFALSLMRMDVEKLH